MTSSLGAEHTFPEPQRLSTLVYAAPQTLILSLEAAQGGLPPLPEAMMTVSRSGRRVGS